MPFCRVRLTTSWQSSAYPKLLNHLGDHIRKQRLDLELSQGEAAHRIGVNKRAIADWELGRFKPTVSSLPAIIEFLGGADPRPEPASLPQWLVWYRGGRGLSQEAMAKHLGVAPRTLWLWETGKARPGNDSTADLRRLGAPA